MPQQKQKYEPLTPLMCARLAAPHTWPGPAVLTTVFGGVFSMALGYPFSPGIWCLLLAVAIFAQSAVNTLNDWADYRAGTDTVENSDDPTDAVLVYNNPDPSHVLALGVGYMLVALVCGIACVVWSKSAVPLVLGLIGGLFIFAYSNGKIPVSYLPLGEVVSGVVMGGLIPLCDVCVFAAHAYPGSGPFDLFGQLDWPFVLMCMAPFVIGVGMVMATQNNCDIERDEPVGRRTLPVVLGRRHSLVVYRVFVVLWIGGRAAPELLVLRRWVLGRLRVPAARRRDDLPSAHDQARARGARPVHGLCHEGQPLHQRRVHLRRHHEPAVSEARRQQQAGKTSAYAKRPTCRSFLHVGRCVTGSKRPTGARTAR